MAKLAAKHKHWPTSCPAPGEGVHAWTLAEANRCRNAGLSPAQAERLIAGQMTRPPSPTNEIAVAVRKAYGDSRDGSFSGNRSFQQVRPSCRRAPVPITALKFDLAKLHTIAGHITIPANWRHWLWERSPKRPEAMNTFSFLENLYRSGEKVLVFDKMNANESLAVLTMASPPDCRVPPLIRAGGGHGLGCWFLCNPVDGEWHPNPRNEGKPSCRSEESVTAFRYAVLESDKAPVNDWLALLAQLPIRIAAIYTSGGRSVHCLVRIDAASKEQWDGWSEPLKRPLKVLGADTACLSAVRLTRLPQCWRPEKQGFQRLLYLNPDPTEMPLIEMPALHSRAWTLARWRRNCRRWNPNMEAFT